MTALASAIEKQARKLSVAERERLRHADHRLVGGLVAVRVELAEDVADDRRRLPGTRARRQPQVREHRVQDAALDGLEPVAHVGERPRRDDAQGVAEVALLGRLAKIGIDWLHRRTRPPCRAHGTGARRGGHRSS